MSKYKNIISSKCTYKPFKGFVLKAKVCSLRLFKCMYFCQSRKGVSWNVRIHLAPLELTNGRRIDFYRETHSERSREIIFDELIIQRCHAYRKKNRSSVSCNNEVLQIIAQKLENCNHCKIIVIRRKDTNQREIMHASINGFQLRTLTQITIL